MSDLPMNPKPPGMSLPILTGPPKAKDPVCGMSVDPTKAAGKIAHNGKTYYFCSKRCEERFTQEPEKFLAAPGTVGMEHAHGRAHPQAQSPARVDRKSTRLNSSHSQISYAVFCLKKK